MQELRFTTTINRTWLIFDPNKNISISVDTNKRSPDRKRLLTVSFSGYLAGYQDDDLPMDDYPKHILGTIYHYIGGVDFHIPSSGTIYDSSGHRIDSGAIASPSFIEMVDAVNYFCHPHHSTFDGETLVEIVITKSAIGIVEKGSQNPVSFLDFKKGLAHKQVHIELEVFNELRDSFGYNTLSTLLGEITSSHINHDYEIVAYEDEKQYGCILWNGSSCYSNYYLVRHTKPDPYLLNDNGIYSPKIPVFLVIPHGFGVQHIFHGPSIMLFFAEFKSDTRSAKQIDFKSSTPIEKGEHFTVFYSEYRRNSETEGIEREISIKELIAKGEQIEEEEVYEIACDYESLYAQQADKFKDMGFILNPANYFLLGAFSKTNESYAKRMFLAYITEMTFCSSLSPGWKLSEDATDDSEDRDPYIDEVQRFLGACETKFTTKLWKDYLTYLQIQYSNKKAQTIKITEMRSEDLFHPFLSSYIFEDSLTDDYITGLISSFLRIIEWYPL